MCIKECEKKMAMMATRQVNKKKHDEGHEQSRKKLKHLLGSKGSMLRQHKMNHF
jgi:hypothetical protein